MIVDGPLAADILWPAAGTDYSGLPDLVQGNSQRNDYRMQVHPDQGAANVDPGFAPGVNVFYQYRIWHFLVSYGRESPAGMVWLGNGVDLL